MHYTLFFIAGFLFSLFHLIIYMGVQTPTSFKKENFVGYFLSLSHMSPERISSKSNEAITTPKYSFIKMETETVNQKN